MSQKNEIMTKEQVKSTWTLYNQLKQMNHGDFLVWYETDLNVDLCTILLDYEDFIVYEIDHTFWYCEQGANDLNQFFEVELIAELTYDIIHDLNTELDSMHLLFDCDMCGEYISEEYIKYLWFKEKEEYKTYEYYLS